MSKELISIIVPIFNSSKYLKKCIDSLIGQTYKNIEIICVDDGSTDESVEILNELMKCDSRIKVFVKQNSGVYETRRYGFIKSTGSYVIFIDSDDWIDLNCIEKMMNVIDTTECDIVKTCIQKNFEYNKKTIYYNSPYSSDIVIGKKNYPDMVYPIFINSYFYNSMCGSLINRNIVNFANKTLITMAEDLVFNLQLYTNSNNVYILNDYMYHYRANLDSVTNNILAERKIKVAKDAIMGYLKLLHYSQKWKLDILHVYEAAYRVLKEYILQLSSLFYSPNYKMTYKKFLDLLNEPMLTEPLEILKTQDVNLNKYAYAYLYLKNKYILYIYLKLSNNIKCILKSIVTKICVNKKRIYNSMK